MSRMCDVIESWTELQCCKTCPCLCTFQNEVLSKLWDHMWFRISKCLIVLIVNSSTTRMLLMMMIMTVGDDDYPKTIRHMMASDHKMRWDDDYRNSLIFIEYIFNRNPANHLDRRFGFGFNNNNEKQRWIDTLYSYEKRRLKSGCCCYWMKKEEKKKHVFPCFCVTCTELNRTDCISFMVFGR